MIYTKLLKSLLTGLVLVYLAGCANSSKVIDRVVTIRPPTELLRLCPPPTGTVRTNEELAELFVAYRTALRSCNADKQSLQEWEKETQ